MFDEQLQERIDKVRDAKPFMIARLLSANDILSEMQKEKESVLSTMYKNGQGYDVVSIIENSAILKSRQESKKENPYTSNILVDEKWISTSYLWPTHYEAFMHAVGVIHEGSNTRFARYAYNMIKQINDKE